jgi:SAM-dependent methyltransferase
VAGRPGASVSAEVPLAPEAAFHQIVDELVEALARLGLHFTPGPDGTVERAGEVVGRVQAWRPGEQLLLDWSPAPWDPTRRVEVELRVEPWGAGSRVVVEHRGIADVVGPEAVDWTGWVGSAVIAPFLGAIVPASLGDWMTDRLARRPSGPRARTIYADPVFHRPNFQLLLDHLHPGPDDRVLEVGCGGGALLHEILARGARGVGIDHSPEMVRLAQSTNRAAVKDGRLQVHEAEGSHLPVADGAFTIALSTGVFGFLPRPLETLREMARALAPGGRLAVFTGTRALAGTPACPEPVASRIRFFEDDELAELAEQAGFVDIEVTHPALARYARAAGVPEEGLALFEGTAGAQLLVAHRSAPPAARAVGRSPRPAPKRANRKATPDGRARRR